MELEADAKSRRTSPLFVALAWAIVATPLGWGVYQSVVKSLPLFHPRTSERPPASVPPRSSAESRATVDRK